MDISQVR